MVLWAIEEKRYFGRRACALFGISRTSQDYESVLAEDDREISELLIRLADSHKRWGFGLMFRWLKRNGYQWNHKRVYRIYCELALNLRDDYLDPRLTLSSEFMLEYRSHNNLMKARLA